MSARRVLGAGPALALLVLASPAWAQDQASSDIVKRGEYLARAADCTACHTAPGGKPFAGGLAFQLPFKSTLYSPNITPDKEDGIGQWSDDDFVRALHEGVGRAGTHYFPAFPYTNYTLMPREDVLAIKAYLFSLQPVHANPPGSQLNFPLNQRWGMWFWNLLYNPDKRFAADPGKPAEWNRGAYLVEGPGHCGACHTPRNLLLAPKSSEHLAGAEIEGWRAYNITPDKDTGVGAWSEQELGQYLATGHAQNHGAAAGPMAEAVEYSLRYLTPEDIHAMVVYLRSLPPKRSDEPAVAMEKPALKASLPQLPGRDEMQAEAGTGARVFEGACASCHGFDGSGLATPYAALLGSRAVNDPRATNVAQVLVNGASLGAPGGAVFMPGFAGGYSDAELAAVANYVTGRFGSAPSHLAGNDVRKLRQGAEP